MEGHHTPPVGKPAGQQIPVGGAKGREQKESPLGETLERTGTEVKKAVKHVCNQAGDICTHWRHYPKMITGLLILGSLLTGAGIMSGVQGTGFFGGGRHFLSTHWDRETADAHHALDVVLDHLKHPQYYRSEKAEGMVHKAKRTMYGLFEGMMPGRKTKTMGRDMYEGAQDLTDDISHGARRSYEKMKDTGYDIKDRIGDWGQTIKEKLTPGTDYGYEAERYGKKLIGDRGDSRGGWFSSGSGDKRGGWFGSGSGTSGGGSSWFGGDKTRGRSRDYDDSGSSWFGGGDREHQDELDIAARKVKGVVREAERDM